MTGLYDFFNQNSLAVVLAIVLVIWAGIVWYLVRLGRRVQRLEETGKKEG